MNTEAPHQHKVWMSPELKADVTRHWRMNPLFKSESDLGRSILTELATHGVDESQLADMDMNGKASMRIHAVPSLWAAAGEATNKEGLSLHSVIRRRLIRMITGNH